MCSNMLINVKLLVFFFFSDSHAPQVNHKEIDRKMSITDFENKLHHH
jgi:hypothetical protein